MARVADWRAVEVPQCESYCNIVSSYISITPYLISFHLLIWTSASHHTALRGFNVLFPNFLVLLIALSRDKVLIHKQSWSWLPRQLLGTTSTSHLSLILNNGMGQPVELLRVWPCQRWVTLFGQAKIILSCGAWTQWMCEQSHRLHMIEFIPFRQQPSQDFSSVETTGLQWSNSLWRIAWCGSVAVRRVLGCLCSNCLCVSLKHVKQLKSFCSVLL